MLLQNFWQRIRNYIQRQLLQQMQRSALADVAAFTRETGRRLRFYDEGVSTSVAIVAPVDFALEFPQPLPPRIHVSNTNASDYCDFLSC